MLHVMKNTGEITGNDKEDTDMEDSRHTLIAAIVNRGCSGDVMKAARAAGAKGGTVINSRRIGNEEAASFWGLSAQEEKEIILILSETDDKVEIMHEISTHCGMQSEAKGIVMSMSVDSVIGI